MNGPQGTTAITPTDAEGKPTAPAVRIHIAGDDDEALQKLQREADAEAKRAQNQLPAWIAQSTISGEPARSAEAKRGDEPEAKPVLGGEGGVDEPAVPAREAGDDLDAYYASLAQEGDGVASSTGTPAAGDYLDAASVALPASATQSPLFSPLPTPPTAKDSASAADDDSERAASVEAERGGKRSRDEVDSGWDEGVRGGSEDGGVKKPRMGSVSGAGTEDEEDDFEEVEEGDGDPNPLITIGDKQVPFLDVGDELQAAMVSPRLSRAGFALAHPSLLP